MHKHLTKILLAASLATLAGCGGGETGPKKPKLAFVTNCVAEFWTIGAHGVQAAADECGAEVSVHMPASGEAAEQKRLLEDLLSKGVQGIAVSPKDPDNMTGLLDQVAGRALLVTHDSDAPASKRLAYIGMSNYDAGRMCGQLVKEAIPDGGVVVVLVGTLDQDNAKGRRQGVIDELLGRSHDPSRFDPQDAKLKGDKYEIRATFTDEFDRSKAKSVAEDSLVRWADVGCMVGLFEYEPPLILEAVKSAGRMGKVKIVGFDENAATLQGILDDHIAGTVVQNPYEYGRQSILLLDKLVREPDAEKRAALLPAGGYLDIPARRITKTNVQAFWDDLKKKTGK